MGCKGIVVDECDRRDPHPDQLLGDWRPEAAGANHGHMKVAQAGVDHPERVRLSGIECRVLATSWRRRRRGQRVQGPAHRDEAVDPAEARAVPHLAGPPLRMNGHGSKRSLEDGSDRGAERSDSTPVPWAQPDQVIRVGMGVDEQ